MNAIRYEAATILQPRARMEAYWKQVHDVHPAEAPDLPPADARAVVVVFYRADRNPMNFEATVCDEHQRERVLELLTKGAGLDLTRQGGGTKEDSRPSHEQLALSFKGKTIAEAVALLGAPTLVRPRGCDGVGLTYVDNAAGRGLRIDFARDGQFVSQQAAPPN